MLDNIMLNLQKFPRENRMQYHRNHGFVWQLLFFSLLIKGFMSHALAETPFTSAIDRTFQLFARGELPPAEELDALLKDVGSSDFAPATLIGILSNTPSFGHEPSKTEQHLRSMGLSGALLLNSKLNADGGSQSSRYFAAKLAFNNSLQRSKFQSWYTALIKQKALRYLVDSDQSTPSDIKSMYGDVTSSLLFSALNGNVPAAYQFIRNRSKHSNKLANARVCVVLASARLATKEIEVACGANKFDQEDVRSQLEAALTETEKVQRKILSSKFAAYSSVMCAKSSSLIEDRLRCTTKLSAAIELCRVTDASAKYKVLEGQFLCDNRALVSTSNMVEDLFKQMQSD
jgi:hypothetical protein